jgi:polar amino acid transport system permease protein
MFLDSLAKTVGLSLAAGLLATVLGCAGALLRVWGPAQAGKMVGAVACLFRNTPLLVQLYLFYRGLHSVGIVWPAEVCGVVGLGLYTGAYLTETFRTVFLSVPRQQVDAALSLGMGRLAAFRWVLLPQALPALGPPLANQWVSLSKNSALLAFITVEEVFHFVYKGAVDAFQPLPYFTVGIVTYLGLGLLIGHGVRQMCRRRWHGG